MTSFVYAIATMDTKGEELLYLADCLRQCGTQVRTIDVSASTVGAVLTADITREQLLRSDQSCVAGDRASAVTAMGRVLSEFLQTEQQLGRVAGVIGLGGSGGTALITAAMRSLDIGIPKLMVSTMASGNTAPYVDCSDIMMMYSVVDVAGLNAVSRKLLANAAHAMAGMANQRPPEIGSRPALGMTMFGVTTPCVTKVRTQLESLGYDALVFHATGTGGRAMENLVQSGFIKGVLDITTTEVADEVVGGIFPAGANRFEITLGRGVPALYSVGAVDMVNFGSRASVPNRFSDRNLYAHNDQITLMRTTPDENIQIARWIADKLNRSVAPIIMLLPEQGVSALDAPGKPFHDPEANEALFSELEQRLVVTPQRKLMRVPYHINDPEFADIVVSEFRGLQAMLEAEHKRA